MARVAYQLTLANPQIRAEVIEVNEFPDLAERYGVRAVPMTVINDRVAIPGAVPPETLIEQVMKPESQVATPSEAAGPTSPAAPPEPQQRIERGKERPSGLFIP